MDFKLSGCIRKLLSYGREVFCIMWSKRDPMEKLREDGGKYLILDSEACVCKLKGRVSYVFLSR